MSVNLFINRSLKIWSLAQICVSGKGFHDVLALLISVTLISLLRVYVTRRLAPVSITITVISLLRVYVTRRLAPVSITITVISLLRMYVTWRLAPVPITITLISLLRVSVTRRLAPVPIERYDIHLPQPICWFRRTVDSRYLERRVPCDTCVVSVEMAWCIWAVLQTRHGYG